MTDLTYLNTDGIRDHFKVFGVGHSGDPVHKRVGKNIAGDYLADIYRC